MEKKKMRKEWMKKKLQTINLEAILEAFYNLFEWIRRLVSIFRKEALLMKYVCDCSKKFRKLVD